MNPQNESRVSRTKARARRRKKNKMQGLQTTVNSKEDGSSVSALVSSIQMKNGATLQHNGVGAASSLAVPKQDPEMPNPGKPDQEQEARLKKRKRKRNRSSHTQTDSGTSSRDASVSKKPVDEVQPVPEQETDTPPAQVTKGVVQSKSARARKRERKRRRKRLAKAETGNSNITQICSVEKESPATDIKPVLSEEANSSFTQDIEEKDKQAAVSRAKKRKRRRGNQLSHTGTDSSISDKTDSVGEEKPVTENKPVANQGDDFPPPQETEGETVQAHVSSGRKRKKRRGKRANLTETGNRVSRTTDSVDKKEPVSVTDPKPNQEADLPLSQDTEEKDGQDPVLPAKRRRKMNKKAANTGTDSAHCPAPKGSPTLNSLYNECKIEIRKEWSIKGSEGEGVPESVKAEVIKEPFNCCYLPDLLEDPDYLKGVENELQEVELVMKSNDLYKFRQTSDLKGVTSPYISGLRKFLYGELRGWLTEVTGIPLNDTVDMGSSRYEHTDVLLCHDDELEGRRIAYILYLVPPWTQGDGGSLDLFSTDEHGQPKDVVRSLVPRFNSFAFFEVSPVSFHQVSEVLSQDKVRLSINGWFHGPPIVRPSRYLPPAAPLEKPVHIELEEVYSWINPMYLNMKIQKEIRHKFCLESELELENFLTEEAYQKLSEALRKDDLAWHHTGPANKQSYEILGSQDVPEEIQECQKLLQSETMFLILSHLTGLKLHPMAPQDSDPDSDEEEDNSTESPCPRMSLEVCRWGQGSYTLIRDDCVDTSAALDAFLFLNVAEDWSQEQGGYVSYIAKDEDEELLTVVPRSKCLCLVYRDAQTLKFTKHINANASNLGSNQDKYQSFACTYYENKQS